MSKLLEIGTELYFLEESIADRWFCHDPYHYEITHGTISRINIGGYKEYVVQMVNRLGRKSDLRYAKTSQLGKSFWLTYQEAVEAAEKATDEHEKRWRETLMRPWRTKNEEQTIGPEQYPV